MAGTRNTGTVREWNRGEPLTRARMNETVTGLNSLLTGTAPPSSGAGIAARGQVVRRFKVTANAADYLDCTATDGTDDATDTVKIAKPYLLRNSLAARNGIDYTYSATDTREADDGATTEDQVVVPSYVVGDEIYAMMLPRGGTGVTVEDVAVLWLDINIDARAWSKAAV